MASVRSKELEDCKKFLLELHRSIYSYVLTETQKKSLFSKETVEVFAEQKPMTVAFLEDIDHAGRMLHVEPSKQNREYKSDKPIPDDATIKALTQEAVLKNYLKLYIRYKKQGGNTEKYLDTVEHQIMYASGKKPKDKEDLRPDPFVDALGVSHSRILHGKEKKDDTAILGVVDTIKKKDVRMRIVQEVFNETLDAIRNSMLPETKEHTPKEIERIYVNTMKAMNRMGLNCCSDWSTLVDNMVDAASKTPKAEAVSKLAALLHYDSFVQGGVGDYEKNFKLIKALNSPALLEFLNEYLKANQQPVAKLSA